MKPILLFSVICTQLVSAQISLFNFSSTTPGLTSTCIQVINQAVNCNSSITWAGLNGRLETDATLASACTVTCSSALATWQRRVSGACGTQRFQSKDGYMVLAEYLTETYVERFNQLCLVDTSGHYCNAIIRNLAGINPVNQKQTAAPAAGFACNDCVLRIAQTQLEMPLSSNVQLSSQFAALTSSCSKTNYSITTATTTTLKYLIPATTESGSVTHTSATPTSCAGTKYTIKAGDTCQSVSSSQGISTANLLSVNGLQAHCRGFPTSGTLCIPNTSKCSVYTIKTNDTCASVASAHSVYWAQIVSWNPDVGLACSNLAASHTGWSVCVSNPGGSWINPIPTTVTTTSSAPNTLFTMPLLPFSAYSFAQATHTGVLNDSTGLFQTDPYSTPYANGTRLDCTTYATGSSLTNTTTNTTINTCSDIASGYQVQLSDFLSWNPSLNNRSPCVLNPHLQYCTQLYIKNATNVTGYCSQLELAPPGLSCSNFSVSQGVALQDLALWNPTITADSNGYTCHGFTTGLQYCVAVLHFKQPGIVSTCNSFAMANDTSFVLNTLEPCTLLETKYGLSHARFVAWNPALGTDCLGISQYYDYCVSIPGYKPTYTTPGISSTIKSSTTTSKSITTSKSTSTTKITSTAKSSSTTKISSTGKITSTAKTTSSSTKKP